jgi:hypothetical protein
MEMPVNQGTHDAPAALAGAPDAGMQLQLRRLQSRYGINAATPARPAPSISDADRFRWIRANRGNFAIDDALRHSNRDVDFDARIDAAMRMSMAGRHVYTSLVDLTR